MDVAEDVLFVAQSADASCYHRDDAPGDRARLRLVRARLAAAADDARPRRGAVRRGGPDLGALPRSSSCRRRAQEGWLDADPELQAGGTKVVFDVDYHLHEIVTDDEKCSTLVEALLGHVRRGDLRDARTSRERYARFNPRTSSARTAST